MYSVSIIIPVYNVEKYIERCLVSIMEQKGYEGYVECILVDDCSSDKSIIIAQKLIEGYQGPISFLLIHNPENQGPSCARNNGLYHAKGDYVLFLDSDDYISHDCLANLLKELYRHEGVIDMVIGNSYDNNHDKYWQDCESSPFLITNHTDLMRRFLGFEIPMVAWNKLVHRQFLLEHHLLFEPHMLHEDELWSYNLYNVAKSVVLIPEVTYHYEKNDGSIMNSTSNLNRRVEAYHSLVSHMLSSLGHNDLYVDRFFWGIHFFMIAFDMILNNELSPKLKMDNKELSRKMLVKSFCDGRLAIAFFVFLTTFQPFNRLVRFSWFRHRYHLLVSFFKKLALKGELVHGLLTNCL